MSGVAALFAALFLAKYIPAEFQPTMDQGELDIVYSMPEGASIASTFDRGEAIRKIVAETEPETRHVLVTVGAGQRQKVNEGKVFVKLTGSKERKRGQAQISAQLRQRLSQAFPGADISVNKAATAGDTSGEFMAKPLNIQLRADDSTLLRQAARDLVAALQKQKGFVDLSVSDKGDRPQFGFNIDREKISEAGLAPAQVAGVIRTAINGTEVSQFKDGSERYKIVVEAPDRYREQRSAVLSLPLRGAKGSLIELGELVRAVPEGAPAQIDREDRIRQVSVLGNLDGIALGGAQEVVTKLSKELLPKGVAMQFSGQGELMAESFAAMVEALLLAIIIIYMVLAAQFESFLHPITIMVSLPLSLVGALGGLLVAGQTLSIMSFIGVIMLMGLVTKNAILLVDNANQRREEGKSVRDAMIDAGAARLRPILMTTAAMIFGMLPVAMALGEGSEQRAPMGVTVIGGLLTSTVLTLLVVPAIYSAMENGRIRFGQLFSSHLSTIREKH